MLSGLSQSENYDIDQTTLFVLRLLNTSVHLMLQNFQRFFLCLYCYTCHVIFRTIYAAASGIARVNVMDGKYVYSGAFNVGRGVIQGDIISPVLFILALDALVQQFDSVRGKGFKCGRILRLDVLGYADDVALISDTAEDMTRRLTTIADGAKEHADMNVSMPKTFTQHVHKRDKLTVTEAEAKAAATKYTL